MSVSAAGAQPTEATFHWCEESIMKGPTDKNPKPVNCDRRNVVRWGDGLLVIVADGAGKRGWRAAEMACDMLPGVLETSGARSGDDAAVKNAFETMGSVIKLWTETLTTVTIAIIRPGKITIAHVGDTMAYLIRKGLPAFVELTVHKHNTQTEHEALAAVARGGVKEGLFLVPKDRSAPGIQLTRGLGGKDYGDVVLAVPDVRHHNVHENDRLLIVGSDGLEESIDFPFGRNLVRDIEDATPEAAMYRLMKQYVNKPPNDDVTAVVVDLTPFHL